MKFLKLIRFSDWWNYKVPPMLCFVYFFIAVNNISLKSSLINLFLFLLWIIGTGGLGYILNDISDIKSDRLAGKANYISFVSIPKRILLILFLVLIACIPWFYLPLNVPLGIMIVSEFLLLILYSFPPFRLKESPFGGIVADAVFGHALIILITAMTFNQIGTSGNIGYTFYTFLFIWQLLKGFRNILLHQIDDENNDARSGTMTFVVKYGAVLAKKLIKRIILPLEFITFCVVLGLISIHLHYFYVAFSFFLIMIFLKFSMWKVFSRSFRHFKLSSLFLFFLNDFYEEWMPVIVLLYLAVISPVYSVLVVMHFLFFSAIIESFCADIKAINKNIHDQINESREKTY